MPQPSTPTIPTAVLEREPGQFVRLPDLAQQRGVLLLYVSATCGSCTEIIAKVDDFADRLPFLDVVVLVVSRGVIDQLPDVALITADYNPQTQYGRWVLWHHIRGREGQQAFHYVIDPNCWGLPAVTKDFKRLLSPKQPIYYIEVTPKSVGKLKAK